MKTNAGLRKMLDDMGRHTHKGMRRFPYGTLGNLFPTPPIRFADLKIFKAEGLCVPILGIFIDKKHQSTPEPYLQAVVYHEVGHWRDPLVWLSLLAIPALLVLLYLLAATGGLIFLWGIYGLLAGGYFVGIWKERRADAYARQHMADYDVYDKPFVPGRS
ncbi:MAG: hypothetical protein ACYCS8_10665 [Acidithiobacillus sp.]